MSNLDIEKSAALVAALEELFRQYPVTEPIDHTWRKTAIKYALDGYIASAISWARNTGVPIDVLSALEVLLNE